jgi:hypothetical protein
MTQKYIAKLSIEGKAAIFQLLKEGRASKVKTEPGLYLIESGLWRRRGKLEIFSNRRSISSQP